MRMRRLHSRHNLHPRFQQGELTKLYWSQIITTLADGLVAIFIPIFLLTLGYKLSQVLLYMIMFGAFCVPALYIMLKLVTKIGANRVMGLANMGQVVFMVLLITLPTHHWPLLVLAIVAACVNTAYWPAFHANFALSRTPEKAGKQLSYFYVLMAAAGALAPTIGGLLATYVSISLVYAIAAGLFLLAALPMFSGSEVVKPVDFRLARLKGLDIKADLLAYGGWAFIETTEEVVWPIMIFLIVSTYAGVGLLSSALIVTGILTTLYVGRREAVKGEKHYIKRGSASTSLTNLGRIFASTSPLVFGMNLLSGVSFHLLEVPFFTRFYTHVSTRPTLEYLFASEATYGMSLVVFYSILFVFSLTLPAQMVLIIGLILTIPASYIATRMK